MPGKCPVSTSPAARLTCRMTCSVGQSGTPTPRSAPPPPPSNSIALRLRFGTVEDTPPLSYREKLDFLQLRLRQAVRDGNSKATPFPPQFWYGAYDLQAGYYGSLTDAFAVLRDRLLATRRITASELAELPTCQCPRAGSRAKSRARNMPTFITTSRLPTRGIAIERFCREADPYVTFVQISPRPLPSPKRRSRWETARAWPCVLMGLWSCHVRRGESTKRRCHLIEIDRGTHFEKAVRKKFLLQLRYVQDGHYHRDFGTPASPISGSAPVLRSASNTCVPCLNMSTSCKPPVMTCCKSPASLTWPSWAGALPLVPVKASSLFRFASALRVTRRPQLSAREVVQRTTHF